MCSIRCSGRLVWMRWSLLIVAMLLVTLLGACTPAQPKVFRVGVLSGLDFIAPLFDGFKVKMGELGYIEGQNIVYDVQRTNFDMEAYRRILQGFVDSKVDLIVVYPTEASLEAKALTAGTDIPVVFAFALIEGVNLVQSIPEPGGNITGVRFPGPDVALKRFEVLREIVPAARRILVPYQRGYPIVSSQMEMVRPAAEATGVTLIEVPASDPAELEAALQAYLVDGKPDVDAILLLAEPLSVAPGVLTVLGAYAAGHQLPIGGALIAENGYHSIFGVNVDPARTGQQAAVLADKVLRGTPAGAIPVASSEVFLQINYTAAQAAGLVVPDGLLSQADEVIR